MQFLTLTESGGMSIMVIVIYLVVIVGAMYFISDQTTEEAAKRAAGTSGILGSGRYCTDIFRILWCID